MSNAYTQLVESLRLLGADAKDQRSALPEWVHIPDEIALIFHEAALLAPQIRAAGLLTEEQAAEVDKIDSMFDDLDANLWTLSALETGEEWQQVRRTARSWLQKYGIPLVPPTLSWLAYEKGEKAESNGVEE